MALDRKPPKGAAKEAKKPRDQLLSHENQASRCISRELEGISMFSFWCAP